MGLFRAKQGIRYRYTMRFIFVVVMAMCVFFAWLGIKVRDIEQQRIAASWWRHEGAYVSFEMGQVTTIQPFGERILGGDLRKLEKFPYLKMLFLQDMVIDDTALSHIARSKNLEWLVLSDRHVSDNVMPAISNLQKLQYLFLDGTQITERGVAHLSTMQHLKYVNLKRTQVADDAIKKLRGALPNTEIDF